MAERVDEQRRVDLLRRALDGERSRVAALKQTLKRAGLEIHTTSDTVTVMTASSPPTVSPVWDDGTLSAQLAGRGMNRRQGDVELIRDLSVEISRRTVLEAIASTRGVDLEARPMTIQLRDARRDLLEELRRAKSRFYSDLADWTRLDREVFEDLVESMQNDALLVTVAESPMRKCLALAPSMAAAICVSIGRSHVQAAFADLGFRGDKLAYDVAPHFSDWTRFDAENHWPQAVDLAAKMVRDLLRDYGPADLRRVLGIVIALPAAVDAHGDLVDSSIVWHWPGFFDPRPALLHGDTPVVLMNDANLAAVGEVKHGAARDHGVALYIEASSGIGAGLHLDGIGSTPWEGWTGSAGEIGHTRINVEDPVTDGAECICGHRGCLETMVGGAAVASLANRETIFEVVEDACAGDADCRGFLSDAGEVLGRAVANACQLLGPSCVVVGGTMTKADDLFMHSFRTAIANRPFREPHRDVTVLKGELTVAALQGGLEVALRSGRFAQRFKALSI